MVVDRLTERPNGSVLTDDEVDRLFHALADRTRRDIVQRTAAGAHSISELSRHYDMSFAAVQKHVVVLERAHLVGKTRRGREQLVLANLGAVRTAQALLDELESLWRDRLDRFEQILTEPSQKGPST